MQGNDLKSYTIKIAMNRNGIKKFKICNKCNTCNLETRVRCVKCMRKL